MITMFSKVCGVVIVEGTPREEQLRRVFFETTKLREIPKRKEVKF